MIDSLARLRLAVAATRHGGGGVRLATRVRRGGLDSFDEILRGLSQAQVDAVDESAERLAGQNVSALLLGEAGYPTILAASRAAPPALFVQGAYELLREPGIGMCGSRHAADASLLAARTCSETVVTRQLSLVSGYAGGVDMVTHVAALACGGTTVIVLPEGIERFRVRRGEFADVWDPSRTVVVSQFSPNQPWNAGAAMARNAVISGLSRALVVVEAGDTGGTLAAGLHALERGQPVIVLQLDGELAVGNRILLDKGAISVRSRQELAARLANLPTTGSAQLSLI
jgi:DNA processing protein